MTAQIGGLRRGTCDVCGEDVAYRKTDGLPVAHGPYNDRCPGAVAAEIRLKQTLWDRMTGRLPTCASVDERIRNAVDVCAAARAAAHPNSDYLDDEQFLWAAAERLAATP